MPAGAVCPRERASPLPVHPTVSQRAIFVASLVSDRRSPFGESLIPEEYRKLAMAAHEKLADADKIIASRKIKSFCIYTDTHSQRRTDLEYRVRFGRHGLIDRRK
jgi:hypothetical protein